MICESSDWPEELTDWCGEVSTELQAKLSHTFGWDKAEEAVQQALTELIDAWRRENLCFTEYPAFRQWVHKTAKWRAIDLVNKERRTGDIDDAEPHDNAVPPAWRALFRECLEQLDAEDLRILELKYVERCTAPEIAACLWPDRKKSPNALNIDVTRAVEKARDNLRRLLLLRNLDPKTGAFQLGMIVIEL